MNEPLAHIVFGTGCFWCTEAIFQRCPGVISATPGYAGGHVRNPSYEQVCQGSTGHAETCQITYDPSQVSLTDLLDLFWRCHDPTSLNRQGNDVGPTYRSVIYTSNSADKAYIQTAKQQAQERFDCPIVTEIKPLDTFYPAEPQHLDYYNNHPDAAYCQWVIAPKLKEIEK